MNQMQPDIPGLALPAPERKEDMRALVRRKVFDPAAGERAKAAGLEKAAENRAAVLDLARRLARDLALRREDRTCTADDVQRELWLHGHSTSELGNAAGSIFHGEEWEFTGDWEKSARVSNHSHQNRVWRLRKA